MTLPQPSNSLNIKYEDVQDRLLYSILSKHSYFSHGNGDIVSSSSCEDHPLYDEMDRDILIHRDAHFGSHFPTMIDYYQNEGKGCQETIDTDRIIELADMEAQMGTNLADLILTISDKEKIEHSKKLYQELRAIYEISPDKSSLSKSIADLILTEEEDPVSEINQVVSYGETAVGALIQLLQASHFQDPISPGYGLAPGLAARALGKIGSSKAISPLFESMGQGNFEFESDVIEALYAIGKEAKVFLLKIISQEKITKDLEQAALALVHFRGDDEVVKYLVTKLKDPKIWNIYPLSTYLLLGCDGVEESSLKQEIIQLAHDPKLPASLKEDIDDLISTWTE